MFNYIWGGMIIVSIVFGAISGNMQRVSESVITGANDAISLTIKLMGMMCLWTGLMEIAKQSGFIKIISKIFRPITKIIFNELPNDSPALEAIVMNMTANLFGMSNAATPLGLNAMKEMQKINNSNTASNSMCAFVVINTASIQLVPSTIIALRQASGSQNPFEIIVPVWISSIVAVSMGIISAKIFQRRERKI